MPACVPLTPAKSIGVDVANEPPRKLDPELCTVDGTNPKGVELGCEGKRGVDDDDIPLGNPPDPEAIPLVVDPPRTLKGIADGALEGTGKRLL